MSLYTSSATGTLNDLAVSVGRLRVHDASPVVQPAVPTMWFLDQAPEITTLFDELAPDDLLLRPFKKYDLSPYDHQAGELVGVEYLEAAEARAGFALERGDVAVLEFGWDRYLPDVSEERGPMWWASNQPALAADACAYLAGHGISAVACDTAACDFPAADSAYRVAPGHAKHFLHAGIPLVEGLNGLADVPATGLLLVLPLKIERDTVSPVRVLLLSE